MYPLSACFRSADIFASSERGSVCRAGEDDLNPSARLGKAFGGIGKKLQGFGIQDSKLAAHKLVYQNIRST
jgi:hypothetical protein